MCILVLRECKKARYFANFAAKISNVDNFQWIGLVWDPRVSWCLLIGETSYMHVPAYQKTMIAVKQETTRTLQKFTMLFIGMLMGAYYWLRVLCGREVVAGERAVIGARHVLP
jgi:hypothetical protein